MPNEQDIKIAVMESQIEGLREQHKSHKEEITKSLSAVTEAINGIREDIKQIYEFVNKSRGSIAATILGASAIGGIVVAVATAIIGHFIK